MHTSTLHNMLYPIFGCTRFLIKSQIVIWIFLKCNVQIYQICLVLSPFRGLNFLCSFPKPGFAPVGGAFLFLMIFWNFGFSPFTYMQTYPIVLYRKLWSKYSSFIIGLCYCSHTIWHEPTFCRDPTFFHDLSWPVAIGALIRAKIGLWKTLTFCWNVNVKTLDVKFFNLAGLDLNRGHFNAY